MYLELSRHFCMAAAQTALSRAGTAAVEIE
jgi:hypothetical protein